MEKTTKINFLEKELNFFFANNLNSNTFYKISSENDEEFYRFKFNYILPLAKKKFNYEFSNLEKAEEKIKEMLVLFVKLTKPNKKTQDKNFEILNSSISENLYLIKDAIAADIKEIIEKEKMNIIFEKLNITYDEFLYLKNNIK